MAVYGSGALSERGEGMEAHAEGRIQSGQEAMQLVEMPGLQLMQASFRARTFPRHSHEGYGVGVIEQGALGFYYRGENVVAPAGRINTVNPDEVHTGQAAGGQGWTYRMFYFSADFLQQMSQDIFGHPIALPFFTAGVIDDPELARQVQQVHARLCDHRAARLEKETCALAMFSRLISRHTYAPPLLGRAGNEQASIRRVIEYLDTRCAEDVTVAALAEIACLSPYHFIRVFSRQTGLTPHAWLMQLRARKARELLRLGLPIADAAAQTGFADQSHLTKTFKRILGYTPGQLRNSVQDT